MTLRRDLPIETSSRETTQFVSSRALPQHSQVTSNLRLRGGQTCHHCDSYRQQMTNEIRAAG